MRIETKFKLSGNTGISETEIEEGVRLYLNKQALHLKNVRVYLSSEGVSDHEQSCVLFRIDFATGGSLILEERAGSLNLAFRKGLVKVSRALDAEMRRRWIFQDTEVLGRPLKAIIKKIWQDPIKAKKVQYQN